MSFVLATLHPQAVQAKGIQTVKASGGDDTQAIQNALDAQANGGGVVSLQAGTFHVSKTLYMTANVWLHGAGMTKSTLHRTGNYGHTLVVGADQRTSPASNSTALGIHISDLAFEHDHNQTAGTNIVGSGTAPNLISPNQKITLKFCSSGAYPLSNCVNGSVYSESIPTSHLYINNGNVINIEHVKLTALPIGLYFRGGSILRITGCEFSSFFDPANVGWQEGFASVYFDGGTRIGNVKDVMLSNSTLTGEVTPARAVPNPYPLVGGGTNKAVAQPAGPRFGIYVGGLETAGFINNKFSNATVAEITYAPLGPVNNHRIASNTFGYVGQTVSNNIMGAHILFQSQPASAPTFLAQTSTNVQIVDNAFSGQNFTPHSVQFQSSSASNTQPAAYGVAISKNTFNSFSQAPVWSLSVQTAAINNNIFSNYNSQHMNTMDAQVAAAIFLSGTEKNGRTERVNIAGNTYTAVNPVYYDSGANNIHNQGSAGAISRSVALKPNFSEDVPAASGPASLAATIYPTLIPDGQTDNTAAIQAALDQAKSNGGGVVYLPAGRYLVSSTLYMSAKTWLKGEGNESTFIYRVNPSYGHTLVIGADQRKVVSGDSASAVHISDIWFLQEHCQTDTNMIASVSQKAGPQAPLCGTTGSSTAAYLVSPKLQVPLKFNVNGNLVTETTASSHIFVNAGFNVAFERTNLWFLPYNLYFRGGQNIQIIGSLFKGFYDVTTTSPGWQESLASVAFDSTKSAGIGSSVQIISSYFTAEGAVNKTKYPYTYPGAPTTIDAGPQYGLYTNGLTSASIVNNYFGGNSIAGIYFEMNQPVTNQAIYGNFFDGAGTPRGGSQIQVKSLAANATTSASNVEIRSNSFNGQGVTFNSIKAIANAAPATSPAFSNLFVQGNTFNAVIEAPIWMQSVKGSTLADNVFLGNGSSMTTSDVQVTSSIFLSAKGAGIVDSLNISGNISSGQGLYDDSSCTNTTESVNVP